MPSKESAENFVGKSFNGLVILEDLGRINNRRWVMAKCKCGTVNKHRLDSLKDGSIKSCGCVGKEMFLVNRKQPTHNLRYHPLYKLWSNIKSRCYNSSDKSFPDYGGKGVKVCDEWLNDFKSFYDWAITNGYKKGLEIDKDKLATTQTGFLYCPEYCSFLTKEENAQHKSTNIVIEYNGKSMCAAQWSREFGINYETFKTRLERGWSMEKIINTPTDLYHNRKKIA